MNIPNFEDIPVVGKDGKFTDEWRNIMQALFQALQLNAGQEGLVMPTQKEEAPPNDNITKIQNNMSNGPISKPTTQYGTMLYDSTNNSIRIAINDGAGSPLFKTVTLT